MSEKIEKIIDILEKFAPLELQEDWDNSGVLLGDMDSDVKKVLITLDVTKEAVGIATEGGFDSIVSHHPLIFMPYFF